MVPVLHHEHKLTLLDLNPKYPYDEVYDDEDDLIIKQAFQCPCNRCNQDITYLHRYYYKCDQCDYSLHKLCAELPATLEHSSHNAHTLSLFLDELQVECHMCKSIPQYKQLSYHCSQCMYNICLNCGMHGLQCHSIYHPNHQHPLIPTSRQILVNCDACGKEHKGVFYLCNTCFLSFIHSDCVFLPKRLLIQDGTYDRFFHSHPLILTYSFSLEDQEAKHYPRCRVCNDFFYKSENHWVYKCDKCRYYAHIGCAFLKSQPSESSKSGLRISSKEYKEDPNVLHLPLSEKTYNMIKDVVYKETNETSIAHYGHEHPLILVDPPWDDITSPKNENEVLCNACLTQIGNNMTFYRCTFGCDFVLHDWCTRLPVELKNYVDHPQHTLILLPKAGSKYFGEFTCRVCHYVFNGFAYSCVECSYYIDVRCAIIPPEMTHKSHPNHPFSVRGRFPSDYCRICSISINDTGDTYNSMCCKICGFYLHIGCAMLLPDTIKHKYDKHPMTLTYTPVENYDGDYFCEACEEELNPNVAFYHCYKCVQSMHINCAPLIPQIKEYLYGALWVDNNYSNIKYDGDVHKIDDHPHPVSYSLWMNTNVDRCTKCGDGTSFKPGNIFLKCLECEFAIHRRCMSSFGLY